MRKLFLATALIAAGTAAAQFKTKPATTLTPASSAPRDNQIHLESVPRIGKEEALRLATKGAAVFIDVRAAKTFAAGHIKGAISIPQSRLAEDFGMIPADKVLIPYCACHHEETAAATAIYLGKRGLKNTVALMGGWNEWTAAGYPVESGSR